MNTQTSFSNRGQALIASEYLEILLHEDKAPPLDMLLELVPEEPLAQLEESDRKLMTDAEYRHWVNDAIATRAKFSRYQTTHWKREDMKYGNLPREGDPLIDFVRARITHATAKWCNELDCGDTKLQFKEWLPSHLDPNPLLLQWEWGGWSKALQILRIACGLPRFAPTQRAG